MLAGDVHPMLTSMLCSVGLNVLRTRSVLVYVHVHAPCSSTTCWCSPVMYLMMLVMELLMLCISLAVGLYLTSCWSRATRVPLRSYVLSSYATRCSAASP